MPRGNSASIALPLTLAGVVALSAPAMAVEPFAPPASPQDFSLDVGVAYVSLPHVNGFGTAVDDIGYDFVRQFDRGMAIEGYGPTASLHSRSPAFGGRGWFAESTIAIDAVGLWAGSSATSGITLDPAEFVDVLPINGGPTLGEVFFEVGNPVQRVDANVGQFDAAVAIEHDLNDGGLSVLAGARLAFQNQVYSASASDDSGFNPLVYGLDEAVETWFGGPDLAVRFEGSIDGGVSWHLLARAAALYYGADLDATQSVTLLGRNLYEASAGDHDNGFSARIEVGTGLSVPLPGSRARFGIDGSFTWWSAVPQVVNPRSGPGTDAQFHDFAAARLESGEMWSAQATARLTIPLE